MPEPPQPPRSDKDDQPGQRPSRHLERRQTLRSRLPGTKTIRILRPYIHHFRPVVPGYMMSTEKVLLPKTYIGQIVELLRRIVIGSRIATEHEGQERLGKAKGLAVFASDNVSSSAYATEEIMRVLVLAGAAALTLTLPITLAIIALLAIVVTSYTQTVKAYPGGGGSYIVASDNLGTLPGLAAGAALLTDYVLTVAVSVAAGVAALTSIFPFLFPDRIWLGVVFVAVLCVGNLRGLRESGSLFAAPVYVYLVAILGLLGYGIATSLLGKLPAYQAPPVWAEAEGVQTLGLILVLRAFASGCVALTGTEAVSNGVPAFKPPEARNARTVLVIMGVLFGTIFLGMSLISDKLGIIPDPSEQETVVSQLAATLVGRGTPFHFVIQISTALLLVLAANTAFNGFPRLASILATNRHLPPQFQHRGDRLAFSVGIVFLALVAAALIVVFHGSVTSLIPLYTVGVFIAFTLSQAGMVRRWWRQRSEERGWQRKAAINALGALVTGTVAIIVSVVKFKLGAWMVLTFIPLLIATMWYIQRRSSTTEEMLTLETRKEPLPQPRPTHAVVPLTELNRASLRAVSYARSISEDVTAVYVTDDPQLAQDVQQRWKQWAGTAELVVLESPYRTYGPPLLAYIDALEKMDPDRQITIVLSKIVPHRFWEFPFHNFTALRLKLRLLSRRNTIVVDVPFYLKGKDEPEETGDDAQGA